MWSFLIAWLENLSFYWLLLILSQEKDIYVLSYDGLYCSRAYPNNQNLAFEN